MPFKNIASAGGAISSLPQATDQALALGHNYLPNELVMRQVSTQLAMGWPPAQGDRLALLDEPFLSLSGANPGGNSLLSGQYKIVQTGAGAWAQNADGSITLSGAATGDQTTFVSGVRPRVTSFAVEATVKAGGITGTPSIAVGLFDSTNTANWVGAFYSAASGQPWPANAVGGLNAGTCTISGSGYPTFPTYTIDTSRDFTIGALFQNGYLNPTLTWYVRQGKSTKIIGAAAGAWTLDGTHSGEDGASIAPFRLGFQVWGNGSVTVGRFVATHNVVTLTLESNPRLVKYKDGTPYARDGLYYYVLNGWICSFDPETYRSKVLSLVAGKHPTYGVRNFGPGEILYDQDTDTWIYFQVNWSGIKYGGALGSSTFAYGTTGRDLLGGGLFTVPVTDVTISGLPSANARTAGGPDDVWDPALRWDPAASKWLLGFTLGTFNGATGNPGYATCTTAAPTAFTLITSRNETLHEGANWGKVGGTWYLFYATGTGAIHQYPADLSAGYTALTNWLANLPAGLIGNPSPHPCIIAVNDDASTRYLVITMGDYPEVVVLEADQQPTGWEFPVRKLLRATR